LGHKQIEPTRCVVEPIEHVDDEVYAALIYLLPQLSASAPSLSRERFAAIIDSPSTHLLVARDGSRIVGSLILVMYELVTGMRARIEDVVVDQAARGRGIGRALTTAALDIATAHHARTVDLTSKPSRTSANQLYQHMGFEPRESTTYRYTTRS
jgi:ribosomal protein S18 acetylase RimI-like enzyme